VDIALLQGQNCWVEWQYQLHFGGKPEKITKTFLPVTLQSGSTWVTLFTRHCGMSVSLSYFPPHCQIDVGRFICAQVNASHMWCQPQTSCNSVVQTAQFTLLSSRSPVMIMMNRLFMRSCWNIRWLLFAPFFYMWCLSASDNSFLFIQPQSKSWNCKSTVCSKSLFLSDCVDILQNRCNLPVMCCQLV
jgi:hypothetical protein